MGREQMRAADADRQRVADRLRVALDEGRLDLNEYDERVQQAYRARTYGDLDGLLTDLPAVAGLLPVVAGLPVAAGHPPLTVTPSATREWLAQVWRPWLGAVAITSAIWGISSVVSAQLQFFWPAWVAVPWGIVLLFATVSGLTTGAPRKMVVERERKELVRQHKLQRRALQARAIAAGELSANPTKAERRRFVAEAVDRGDLPPKPPKS